ncbi:hypothetical protein [Phycicoccus flavus]|uniref:hypothetical protein n=1 Tax=Phycicoccus flavus TaxID=2502783 RepID=UPI000FEB94E8|nr:hypothetical protein [Phycicoccus flavus]NHA68023.1 hypothetical protein [Phycicoccus flavus]
MVRIVVRLVGVLLALAGLSLTVVGVWLALKLGGSGTAVFTTRPAAGQVVLLPPQVLNRVDADVRVTATPADGDRVWMALANPSDAQDVLGDAEHVQVTGVDVRDWLLTTTTVGSGETPMIAAADLWRQTDDAEGPVTLTVEQAQAPETVVVRGLDGGEVDTVTMTVTDKRWFVEAVVAALVGLFLLVAGVVAAWPRRRRTPVPPPVFDDPSAVREEHAAEPAETPAARPAEDPEEVSR